MADSVAAAERIDARGMVCPMPTIKLGQAMRRVQVGEIVEIVTDDPGSVQNMAAWARNTGHALVESKQDGRIYTYWMRRTR